MFATNRYIEFKLLYSGEEYSLRTHWGEYRTLRLLINNKINIKDFGQCGGFGRCATCMIEICGAEGERSFLKKSEHTSVQRMIQGYSIVRFACQIPITDDLANVKIKILGNSRPQTLNKASGE